MDECGLVRGAFAEHILGVIDPGLREPWRVLRRRSGCIDNMTALVADDRSIIPHGAPEEVDVLSRPVVQVVVCIE